RVLNERNRAVRKAALPAVRPAREPARLGGRADGGRILCAPARRCRAAGERRARAGTSGSAARRRARPPSFPVAGQIPASLRPLGLSAGMARRRAQAQGQDQARCRRRPAEISLSLRVWCACPIMGGLTYCTSRPLMSCATSIPTAATCLLLEGHTA